jgi:hypothetical protein
MQRHAAQSWIAGVQGQSKANLAVATGFRDGAFLAKRTLDGQKAF